MSRLIAPKTDTYVVSQHWYFVKPRAGPTLIIAVLCDAQFHSSSFPFHQENRQNKNEARALGKKKLELKRAETEIYEMTPAVLSTLTLCSELVYAKK